MSDSQLDSLRKLKVMSAFSKPTPSRSQSVFKGAAGFLRKKAAAQKRKDKNRTGIHSTLEVIRRSSTQVLEKIRAGEDERKAVLEKRRKKRARQRAKQGDSTDSSPNDDDDPVADEIPDLFPYALLWSENYGGFKRNWTLGVLVLVVYSTIMIPMEFAFPNERFTEPWLQVAIDLIFIVDVFLTWNTSFMDANGEEVFDKKKIRKNYLKLWFWIDFLACFPLELVWTWMNPGAGGADDLKGKILLRLLKFPRLLRMGRLFKYLERFKYAGCWRVFRLILALVVSAHWTGCVWYAILSGEYNAGLGQTWEVYMADEASNLPTADKYVNAILVALYMLIGEGVDPNTTYQKLYVFTMNIFGSVVMAVIIGNMSLVLQNRNAMSSMFSAKVDQVADSMRAMKVSPVLQEKVLGYYDFLWQRHRVISTKHSFVDELSPCLQNEVNLDLNIDVIQKCGLFRSLLMEGSRLNGMINQEIADHVLVQVVTNLGREVYLPQDVIIQQGETGREMFFLIKGDVAVEQMSRFDENGDPVTKRLAVLHEGSYFGELALLKTHARRAASIVALTPCDVRVFLKKDFDRVCDDFPQLKTYLQAEADKKYAKFAKKPPKGGEGAGAKKAGAGGQATGGPKKRSLVNIVKSRGKALSSTAVRKKNIAPPKKKLTPTQSLVAKIRSSPKLSPKGGKKRPPKSSPLAEGAGGTSDGGRGVDAGMLTSLYTQSARIESLLQNMVKTMSNMDRRLHRLELGAGQAAGATAAQAHPTISTGFNPRSPPNGLPTTVRTVLSPEHRETLHADVRQAQTNARAISIMRRASFSPNRQGRKSARGSASRQSEPNYGARGEGYDGGEKKL
jgi:hypothetical protein